MYLATPKRVSTGIKPWDSCTVNKHLDNWQTWQHFGDKRVGKIKGIVNEEEMWEKRWEGSRLNEEEEKWRKD